MLRISQGREFKMSFSRKITITAVSGTMQQARMLYAYCGTAVNNSGITLSFIGTGRSALAPMTLRKNMFWVTSKRIPLRTSGLERPYRRLRRQFRRDWEELPLCRDCSYAYEGGNCYNQIISDAFFFNTQDRDQRSSK